MTSPNHTEHDNECDEWETSIDGQTWKVWRGWGDDDHEHLYRSPQGNYYLGTKEFTSWAGQDWRKTDVYVPPYEDEGPWRSNPLRAAPPCCLRTVRSARGFSWNSWADVFTIACAQPREFMFIVAAAWFLDRDQGGHEYTWELCPEDLQDIARDLELVIRFDCIQDSARMAAVDADIPLCDVCPKQFIKWAAAAIR